MLVYLCDMCGAILKSVGEMTEVEIKHAGKSEGWTISSVQELRKQVT